MLLQAAALFPARSFAQVKASGLRMQAVGSEIELTMTLDVSSVRPKKGTTVVITPSIQGAGKSVSLPAVEIAGRRDYVWYRRNKASYGSSRVYPADGERQLSYSATVPYEPWMESSVLMLSDSRKKCCRKVVEASAEVFPVSQEKPSSPSPVYAFMKPSPDDGIKIRSMSAKAYISFRTGRWDIDESYRTNRSEMASIKHLVETVLEDGDSEITSVFIKGFASPEGMWDRNSMLAENRTSAVKYYLIGRYSLKSSLVSTAFEPEDWEGVRDFVEKSTLPRRDELLSIIDSPRHPDNKEYYIRINYPEQYKVLYRDCYPALRHIDVTVGYKVRSFTDIRDLERIYRENPEKLSLQEMYTLAAKYEEGSVEFSEIYEIAARLHPRDRAANVNAALSAIMSGNYAVAEEMLVNAGNGAEAVNARGILAWMKGDRATALRLFERSSELGLEAGKENASLIKSIL